MGLFDQELQPSQIGNVDLASYEDAPFLDQAPEGETGPLVGPSAGIMSSVVKGAADATGTTQLLDYAQNPFMSEGEKQRRNEVRDQEMRSTNKIAYGAGAMGSMAMPFMSGMNYGRGLAAMSVNTAKGASQIGNSVARRQMKNNAGAFFRDAADNGLGQAIKKNKFNSGVGNFIAEEAAGIGLGVGYDYAMDQGNQAVYDKESQFDLGNSLALNAAMSLPFAGGMAATRLIKGAKTNKSQVKDYKKQAAESDGLMKLDPNVAKSMKKKGGKVDMDGDQWTFTSATGDQLYGTKIGDDFYVDTARGSYDDEQMARSVLGNTEESISTVKNYAKAKAGESKKYGEQVEGASGTDKYDAIDDSMADEGYSPDMNSNIGRDKIEANMAEQMDIYAADLRKQNPNLTKEQADILASDYITKLVADAEQKALRKPAKGAISDQALKTPVRSTIEKQSSGKKNAGGVKEADIKKSVGNKKPITAAKAKIRKTNEAELARIEDDILVKYSNAIKSIDKGKESLQDVSYGTKDKSQKTKIVDDATKEMLPEQYNDFVDSLDLKRVGNADAQKIIKDNLKEMYSPAKSTAKNPYRKAGDSVIDFTGENIKKMINTEGELKALKAEDVAGKNPEAAKQTVSHRGKKLEDVQKGDEEAIETYEELTTNEGEVVASPGLDGGIEPTMATSKPFRREKTLADAEKEKRTGQPAVNTGRIIRKADDTQETLTDVEYDKRRTSGGYTNDNLRAIEDSITDGTIDLDALVKNADSKINAKNANNFSQENFTKQMNHALAKSGSSSKITTKQMDEFLQNPKSDDPKIKETKQQVLDSIALIKSDNIEAGMGRYSFQEKMYAEKEVQDLFNIDPDNFNPKSKTMQGKVDKAFDSYAKDIYESIGKSKDGKYDQKQMMSSIGKANRKLVNDVKEAAGYKYQDDVYDLAFEKVSERLFYKLAGDKAKFGKNTLLPDQIYTKGKKGYELEYASKKDASAKLRTAFDDIKENGFGFVSKGEKKAEAAKAQVLKDAETMKQTVPKKKKIEWNVKGETVPERKARIARDRQANLDREKLISEQARIRAESQQRVDQIFNSANEAVKQKNVKAEIEANHISTVDTADQHWYDTGEFTTLNVEGVDATNAMEIDMNSANQMVWGSDIKSDAALVDGQIFMKDGSKAVNADNIKRVTHELVHDSIRRRSYTPEQLQEALDAYGVKYSKTDDLEELLTQKMTDDLADDILTQNSQALKIDGYTSKRKTPKQPSVSEAVRNIESDVIGLFNNPASGVNKWLSGYVPFKAPDVPSNFNTNMGERLHRKATSFELVDDLFTGNVLNPWLKFDDNSARMAHVSGMQKSMMNTQSESLSQDKKFMEKAMNDISKTADEDFGKGIFYGAGMAAKKFFNPDGKFNSKGFNERIKSADDTFDTEIENVQNYIAGAMGVDSSKIKFGAKTEFNEKTGEITIKSKGNEYIKSKKKGEPDKVDESKGYENTLALDTKRVITEDYGSMAKGKIRSATNSYQVVNKFAHAIQQATKSQQGLSDSAIKNIARTLDDTIAAGRLKTAIANGYDVKGVEAVFNDKNGKHLTDIYLDGVESNRGMNQPQFGYNPMNSNFTNGYKLMAVPTGKAGKYNRTGEHLADGQLEIVYGPADELVLGQQDGVLDNGFSQAAAQGEITYNVPRGQKNGTIIVDGKEYKVGKGVKPVGNTTGNYTFKLKDSTSFDIPDGVDYKYSNIFSRNTFASTQKRMDATMNSRILNFLRQQGDVITGTQVDQLAAKESAQYIPFTKDPITGDMLFMNKQNKDILGGTEGMKVTNKFLAPAMKITRGVMQAAKNGIIIGRPASYINSYAANTLSLMIHGNYASPARAIRDVNAAKAQVKTFVAKRDKVMELFADPRKTKQAVAALERLEKDPLFYAMNDGGLQTSVRGDLSNIGLMPRNDFITTMKNNGIMNLSEDAAKMLETATLQPNTKMGNSLGEIFDYTEIAPKVALHNALVKQGKTHQEAATYVKMAFPDYNMNLPQVAALADEFMPFMKYFMNVPRMTAFTMAQKPGRILAVMAMTSAAVHGSNAVYGGDEYYAENGYIQLAPGVYKYVDSMNNYNINAPTVANTSFLSGIFWPGNLNPLTVDNSRLFDMSDDD